ncbi:TetR/AcrR family transcriptional regulator [Enteractinococcus helveticum]|uniref:TetR/AcrR family transcriptional regulator n=1 Tax=Enteractinococcus helveticum TaxID=1837282 RepID=UPI000696505D|nr:TetR/AcrR family transcriptional regulator [Enteractinococcus helveticum]
MVSNSRGRAGHERARRRLSTDQRRQELIEVAVDLLGSEPLTAFSMDEVAKRSGASRALLYHYFASKRELIRAVVAHESAALRTVLEGAELPEALDAYLAYADTHPHGYRLLHGGTLQADPEVAATIEQTRTQIERAVLTHLRIGKVIELDRLAVRGWTGSVIAICLEWGGNEHVSRGAVHALLMRTLPIPTRIDGARGTSRAGEETAK